MDCHASLQHVLQVMQASQASEESQEGSLNKVEAAEAEVAELQRRVERERQAFAQGSANLIASTTHFDLKVCQQRLTYQLVCQGAAPHGKYVTAVNAYCFDLNFAIVTCLHGCMHCRVALGSGFEAFHGLGA